MNKKIPWGLATGTLGITLAGIFNGTAMLRIEKKKLRPELMLELR
jgi:hypothetical protein